MCGRVSCTLAPQKLLELTDASEFKNNESTSYSSFNAPPTSSLPVLMSLCNCKIVQVMKWGLIPSFSDTCSMIKNTSNARSESILSNSLYKRLVKGKRCVLLIDGFYEWCDSGIQKQPYFISSKNSEIMYVAALYDIWKDKDGNSTFSFSLLTKDSEEDIKWLHSRMPVILNKEDIDLWLNKELSTNDISNICKNATSKTLSIYKVSPIVNSVKNNVMDCKRPFEDVKKEKLANFFSTPQNCKETKPQIKQIIPKQTDKITVKQKSNQHTLHSFWGK